MKILIVNSVIGPGSTGWICVQLARNLQAQGHEVMLAYGRPSSIPDDLQGKAKRIGGRLDATIHGIATRTLDRQGRGSKQATKRFLRWAESFDPDLLWLHNIHGYYINYEILFSWIKTRPDMKVNWTLHDCWAFTGHCAYFTISNCYKWREGCAKCSHLRSYPSCYVLSASRDNFRRKRSSFTGVKGLTLITPSQWLADMVKESFLGDYPVRVVHNGIDLSIFKPTESDFTQRYGIEGKRVLLGVAADWCDQKGLDVFIELAKRLGDEYKIVLVGTNDKVDSILPDSIISIHRTEDQRELAGIYTAADLFVNPTREDNYPTVNMEAIACGTPVLTFRTGGSPESLTEDTGSVVDCDDVDALEAEIRRICTTRPYSKESCLKRAQAFDDKRRIGDII